MRAEGLAATCVAFTNRYERASQFNRVYRSPSACLKCATSRRASWLKSNKTNTSSTPRHIFGGSWPLLWLPILADGFKSSTLIDEPFSSRTNAGCLPSLESRPFTLLIPELASIAIAHLYCSKASPIPGLSKIRSDTPAAATGNFSPISLLEGQVFQLAFRVSREAVQILEHFRNTY